MRHLKSDSSFNIFGGYSTPLYGLFQPQFHQVGTSASWLDQGVALWSQVGESFILLKHYNFVIDFNLTEVMYTMFC
jgi:hypothetical protein